MLFQYFWLLVLIKFHHFHMLQRGIEWLVCRFEGGPILVLTNSRQSSSTSDLITHPFEMCTSLVSILSGFGFKVSKPIFSTGYICIFIIGHTLLPPRGQCHCNGKKYSHFADLWGAFWLRAKTVGLEVKYINHPICRRNCTESFVTLCS